MGRTFTSLLRRYGGITRRPELAGAFGETTGIGPVRADLLLSPPPTMYGWWGPRP